jgi:hypothetical protein
MTIPCLDRIIDNLIHMNPRLLKPRALEYACVIHEFMVKHDIRRVDATVELALADEGLEYWGRFMAEA